MQGCNFWRFGLIRSIALMSTTFLNHGRFLNHIWISIYLQPIIPNIIRLGKTQKYRLFSTNATTDSERAHARARRWRFPSGSIKGMYMYMYVRVTHRYAAAVRVALRSLLRAQQERGPSAQVRPTHGPEGGRS